jgi:glycine cleavage system H protein
MDFPDDRLYSDYHVWVKPSNQNVLIGLTRFIELELGAINYIELPEPADQIQRDAPFGIVETHKAVSDLIAPISGHVVKVNTEAAENPEMILQDPYESAWLIMLKPADVTEMEALMKADVYSRLIEEI